MIIAVSIGEIIAARAIITEIVIDKSMFKFSKIFTTFQGEYIKFALLCQKDCQRKAGDDMDIKEIPTYVAVNLLHVLPDKSKNIKSIENILNATLDLLKTMPLRTSEQQKSE